MPERLAEFEEKLAVDSRLRESQEDYVWFLMQLWDKGIIEPIQQNERCVEEVGCFFVTKKDPFQLRLVFDTRRSILWFASPPSTHLPSAENVGDLEVGCHAELFGATADVEVCVYQYLMPKNARRHFGLPAAAARWLPDAARRRLEVRGEDEVRFRVLPMGWSWSVHLVQALHLEVFRRAGIEGHFTATRGLWDGAMQGGQHGPCTSTTWRPSPRIVSARRWSDTAWSWRCATRASSCTRRKTGTT